ncbi:hypothetical protein [Ramlibacter humi]|uniref:Uncharacterized protein n=1 Tax=Ramlibacter humi TaxID=2530451 RepID=A0A4Z0BL98_9BURK|nr:hypothetical protein [Ramlibacter humi]TFZ00103.1 hypothetical protein EZ216_13420 [Ramlibacter humi]
MNYGVSAFAGATRAFIRRASMPAVPRLQAGAPPYAADYQALARGLRVILSRVPRLALQLDFPASAHAYSYLRRQLAIPAYPVGLRAGLLMELMHEIASVGDPLTQAAARRCFERARSIAAASDLDRDRLPS